MVSEKLAFVLFALAPMGWFLAFPNHVYSHPYFIIHEWDFFFIFGIGLLLVRSVQALVDHRRLAFIAPLLIGLVGATLILGAAFKWVTGPMRLLGEAPIVVKAAKMTEPHDVFMTNYTECQMFRYLTWKRFSFTDSLGEFEQIVTKFDEGNSGPWRPTLYFYRTWNKHPGEVLNDPLFQHLQTHYRYRQIQPFVIFNLLEKKETAQSP